MSPQALQMFFPSKNPKIFLDSWWPTGLKGNSSGCASCFPFQTFGSMEPGPKGGHGFCLGNQLFVGGPPKTSGPFPQAVFGWFFFKPLTPSSSPPPRKVQALEARLSGAVACARQEAGKLGQFFFLSADGHGPSPISQSPGKYKDTRKEVFKRGPWLLRRDGVSGGWLLDGFWMLLDGSMFICGVVLRPVACLATRVWLPFGAMF